MDWIRSFVLVRADAFGGRYYPGPTDLGLERQAAAVRHASRRFERGDDTTQDTCGHGLAAFSHRDEQVNRAARAKRSRRLDQRTSLTDVDQHHPAARSHRGDDLRGRRRREPMFRTPFDHLWIHVRTPES
jgi:hypothetical protein